MAKKPAPKVTGKTVIPKNQARPVTGKNVKQTPKGVKGTTRGNSGTTGNK